MARSTFSRLLVVLMLGVTISSAHGQDNTDTGSSEPLRSRPPNIILIMADDLGVEGLGCYGGTSYATPHLDALAETGMRFTHAYAQPLCTNTRLQLMTGLYNDRNWKSFGILDPAAKTIGHFLREAGYRSCIAGKWQLQSYDPPDYPGGAERRGTGMHPRDAGFDHYSLFHSLHTEDKGSRYANPTWLEDGRLKTLEGGYGPDVWVDYINAFIEQEQAEPFFVYYPMALPHWPMNPTPASDDWNDPEKRLIADTKYFGDMVRHMDQCVGKIVQKVDDAGLRDNTLILFYSDNGTHLDITSQTITGPIQGGKGMTTDAGTHVPLIGSWPGVIQPGVSDHLVDSTDFIPTLLQAAGKPLGDKSGLDGMSFYNQLAGAPSAAPQREWIYSFYDPRPGWDKDQFTRKVSARDRRWKLYEDGSFFDIANDPLEQHSIAAANDDEAMAAARKQLGSVLETKGNLAAVESAPVVEDNRPNLVLIIADDMNWDDCGAYGHPAIRTPHIDSLAAEGMLFHRAWLTTNSCSPSRSSILTGRYPHNTGAEQLHWPLPPDSRTFAKVLKDAGYYTAAAGKWHLGRAVKDHFDRIYEASAAGFVLPSGKDGEAPKMIAAQPSGCEDWEKALDDRPQDKPFMMWLAALDPHREYTEGTLDPPHRALDVIVPPHLPDTPNVREDLRLYYDEIGRLDTYVGKVVAKLKQQGVDDNTMILFISDNGRPFPRDKTSLYDGGIRTPWIVRWPAKVAAGTTTNALVSAVDIAATFSQLAGIAQPDREYFTLEGKSFVNVLNDPGSSHRQFAFAEDHWHDYEDHARCVTDGQFKLIRNDYVDLPPTPSADAGRGLTWQNMLKLQESGDLTEYQQTCFRSPRPQWELFDLRRDPGELNNRINDPAFETVASRLQEALSQWTAETGDYIPSRRTPDEFDRVTGEPDHSVRVRPRKSKMETFGTNGKY